MHTKIVDTIEDDSIRTLAHCVAGSIHKRIEFPWAKELLEEMERRLFVEARELYSHCFIGLYLREEIDADCAQTLVRLFGEAARATVFEKTNARSLRFYASDIKIQFRIRSRHELGPYIWN